ncbi:hypothetical protein [Mesorhizobium sp. M7A.F.Ca.US.010.02.1.1]|uniref:hypothetical protein n=1 Tax=Mesorhizobium sp. M7A.F.Ca.US.010.02.1.1 TaxID=2496743 RepID=UPI000FD56942|nr:hypothetical protein [Mesorhizobium sp. M7A.F.Ca.US.010.02.1.1]RUW90243.1 hypothetical protein EOA19_21250 [Mesorhizobium sp. M7A.F.Ca.US.010.02.1.1]
MTAPDEESIPENGLGYDDLMEDRDYLFRLINTIDWEAQLRAIKGVLGRNRAASQAVSKAIDDLQHESETYRGPHHEQIVDEWVDAVSSASYSEAANSMSAIGMIVPMLESIHSQAFYSLGELYAAKGMGPPAHKRWDRAVAHPQRWNCQVYFDADGTAGTDIIRGIRQISAATGLAPFLASDTADWIDAMLTYRNKMFHGGFEWSLEQRTRFARQIEARHWEHFFSAATTDEEPWIFYVRKEVIAEMPSRIEAILDSWGAFVKGLPFELVAINN